MKQMRMLCVVAAFFALSRVALAVTISDVSVRQRWPWSKLVDIDYIITNGTEPVDISVKAYNGEQEIELEPDSLQGDIYSVFGYGMRRITWDPGKSALSKAGALTEFKVELNFTHTPLYIIANLTKGTGQEEQIKYVYEDDLTNGVWGAWERDPVSNLGTPIKSVIWTGVTTNDIYKTEKLVLRRIPAGDAYIFGLTKPVTFTRPFYMGVFECTQRQWELMMDGDRPSNFYNTEHYAARPVEKTSYNQIRGSINLNDEALNVNWPHTGYKVSTTSFLRKLRNATGLDLLDLPTEAQWEYACRAGTTTYFHDGLGTPSNVNSNGQMDAIGRYMFNGGKVYNAASNTWDSARRDCAPSNGTAIVGSYLPNAWGLYDMLGNIDEICLDWYVHPNLEEYIDPVGPPESLGANDTWRIMRGGHYAFEAYRTNVDRRAAIAHTGQSATTGFRIVLILP